MAFFKCGRNNQNDNTVTINEMPFNDDIKLSSFADNEYFEQIGTLPKPIYSAACTCYKACDVHLLGGRNASGVLNTHYITRDGGKTWSLKGNIPVALSNASAVVNNGYMYLLGGCVGGKGVDSVYRYDGSTWSKLNGLGRYDAVDAASVVYNDKIYVIGGWDFSNYTKKVTIVSDNGYNSAPDAPYYNSGSSAVVYNGKIYFLFGTLRNNQNDNIVDKYSNRSLYTFDGETWTKIDEYCMGYANRSVIVYNDEIHVFGGRQSEYIVNDTFVSLNDYHDITISHSKITRSNEVTDTYPNLPNNITQASIEMFNGEPIIIGGHDYDNPLNTCYALKKRYLYKEVT